MRKVPIPTVITAALLVAVLLTYALTFTVRFSDVAVRVKLGRADERSIVREPGIYPRWPWPIETIQRYDKRLQTMDTAEAEVKTFDGRNVIMSTFAVWQIEDPLKFFIRVRTEREAENQIRARIQQVQAAVMGQHQLADFVSLDPELVERTHRQVLDRMMASAAPGILQDYGIALREIGIRRISLPESVSQTVFTAMIAERNQKAAGFRAEGQSIAQAITATAEADARKILEFAERKAQEIRSVGIQASTDILRRIASEDSEFFQYLRVLEALREALRNRSTIFLDEKSLFYEPFVRPPASGASPPAVPDASAPPPGAAPQTPRVSSGAGQE